MHACRFFALLFCLILAAVPAKAQTTAAPADTLKASLPQVLALASLGTLTLQTTAASVTRNGADYQLRLPLAGLSSPPDPAVTAVAHPLRNGRFDIAPMTLPSSGTLVTILSNGTPSHIRFSIGSQAMSAQVGPSAAEDSSYTASFDDIRLEARQADQQIDQTFDRFATDGTIATAPDGRITFSAQTQGTGFRMVGRGANQGSSDTGARALAGHISVDRLDRAQGARLLAASRALIADASAPAGRPQRPDQPAQVPALIGPEARRQQWRALVDAAGGLLDRIEVDETMVDTRFRFVIGKQTAAGMIGTLRVALAGNTEQDRLNSRLGIAADGIAAADLPVETAELMPHHVELKTVLSGVRIAPLLALLRAATDGHSDPALLQTQAAALLGEPGARIGIEALSFDSGPLTITGSAALHPRDNGQLGGEIHIAARGVDALLARIQQQPGLQQMLPMIFLAKGIGRAQGDSLVWDITLADGPLTVNGITLGQPSGKTR